MSRFQSQARALSIAVTLTISSAGAVRAAALDYLGRVTQANLGGATALALSPDGLNVYVVSATRHALVVYRRDPASGLLTYVDTEVDGTGGVDGLRSAQAVAVSADGASVYVAGRQDDAIAVFARDPATGSVAFVQAVIDDGTGTMGIWQIKSVAVSADGLHVFASGRKDPAQPKGSLARFARNPATGGLTFAEAQFDDFTPGVTGLGGGGAVAISPADDNVYVASLLGNSLVVFEFDPATSILTWREAEVDGTAGVDGLAGATGPALSVDGAHLYVAGRTGDELGAFARDGANGEVTFLEAHHDQVTAQGLDGANDVAVHPNGAFLYVASTVSNAVSVFQRQPASGLLSWVAQAVQGVGGVDGIGGASSVAVSPDGLHVYVAGPASSAVAIFGPGDAWDFGDAADPTYPTLLASNGARHLLTPGFQLGQAIDVETDGQPGANADGDDLAGIDDGDGIVFTTPWVPGQPATVAVTASAAGALDAWADWNGDGDWADAGEQIAAGAALAAGSNPVGIVVAAAALPDTVTTARFRLRGAADPALTPAGAAPSGEVEDYRVPVGRGADLGVVATGTATADWQQPFTFTVTVGNAGPNGVTGAAVSIGITTNAGGVSWTCVATGGSCTAAGAGDIDDVVDLEPGGTLVYTIDGFVIDEAPGPWVTASAAVTAPAGVIDPVPSNDTAVAHVLIPSIFHDGFETGDTSRWSFQVP